MIVSSFTMAVLYAIVIIAMAHMAYLIRQQQQLTAVSQSTKEMHRTLYISLSFQLFLPLLFTSLPGLFMMISAVFEIWVLRGSYNNLCKAVCRVQWPRYISLGSPRNSLCIDSHSSEQKISTWALPSALSSILVLKLGRNNFYPEAKTYAIASCRMRYKVSLFFKTNLSICQINNSSINNVYAKHV